ncbi:MAG TPA: T9SS type A sorting domain-containing protein [Chitinispirillaceae bacterium]|nr:T9SS type A sorting domain-containing protein [Chitinispirillaceae bacterium]
MIRNNHPRFKKSFFTGLVCLSLVPVVSAKTLIDYFLPMPIVKPLRSDKWGCKEVGMRDIGNGIEDTTNRSYSYWDGPIIKGPDGKYHMFASRWNQAGGHWDWLSSVGIHAVSDSVMGPYIDKGLTWPGNQGGKGHNLTILELKDGTYASVVSDTRPGDFFTAPTLDGPWTFAGKININANGFPVPQIANLSIIIRPDDGKFMVVARNGQIMISSGGLTGPYVIQGNSIYNTIVNAPNLEDPVLWYSGGLYHIVVNSWSDKKAYHLTSSDGIKNWTNKGLAFDPKSNFLRYTDGTVNHWCKIERPGVFIQNNHVTHFTFAVINVEKDKDNGNDNNNGKVIVVPFDGAAFDGVTDVEKPLSQKPLQDELVQISPMNNRTVSVNVSCKSAYTLRIMQPDGKIVKTVRDTEAHEYTFSKNGFNAGIYIVTVISGKNKISKTVVIN